MKQTVFLAAAGLVAAGLCLPVAPAEAQIMVKVEAGKDKAASKVHVSGSEVHVISDDERASFKLSDNQLKQAVAAYFGKRPNDAYVKSPTPWNDLYKTYNWSQVTVTLRPVSATITGISTEPVVIKSTTFKNDTQKAANFNASVSDQVSNTVSNSYSSTYGLTVGQKISYEVSFEGVGKVGGETSMSFSSTFGKSETKSTSYTVGSNEGVNVNLDPGESVVAELNATRGQLKVRVVYDATLSGQTAVNYNPTFKGHHFWGLPIQNVSRAGKLPTSLRITEDMTVGYYSNASVVLKPD